MRPTREGSRFLLATFLIGLAALNTGNNLIYLIFGMLLSVLILSYMALRLNLHGLRLKVEAAHPVFAGQETHVRITVKNTKRRIRSYSIRVRLLRGLLAEDCSGYVNIVPPMSSETSEVPLVFRRRGRFKYGDLMLESSFPFIFFIRKVKVQVEGEIIVYPRVRELELDALRRGGLGEFTSLRPGRSDDLLMIREFREGDDTKHINWKASARSRGLMVKEFTENQPRMITLVLDNSAPPDEFAFEKGVSFAASVAWRLGLEGFLVRLVMCGAEVPFGTGLEHVYRVLDALAVAMDASAEGCPEHSQIAGDEGINVLILKNEHSPMAVLAAAEGVVVVNAASAI